MKTIEADAFNGCSLLPAFFFNHVETIGDSAFKNSGIKYVDFGASLKSFGKDVFLGCENLYSIKLVEENENFWSSGDVLYGKKNDVNQILVYPPAKDSPTYVIDERAELIPSNTFAYVEKLIRIEFGNGIKRIDSYAFQSCSKLCDVIIGTGLKTINEVPFTGCYNLMKFEVDECNPNYATQNGVLYSKYINNEALLLYPSARKDTSFTTPLGIKKIGTSAFSQQHYLEEVIIANDVVQIQQYAFSGMTRLKKVTIKSAVKSIGTHVFYGCSNLEEVIFEDNVKMIGNYMFAECAKLSTFIISSSSSNLLTIENYAFVGSALKQVTIPDKVKYVMDYAFSDCISLESVSIGKNVQELSMGVFMNCHQLKTVTFATEKLRRIDPYTFGNCLTLTQIDIPSTVEIISDNAFGYCVSLTKVNFKGSRQPAYCSPTAFSNSLFLNVVVPKDYQQLQFCGKEVTKE